MWSRIVTENVEFCKALQKREDLNKPIKIATFFWYITAKTTFDFKRKEEKRIPGLFVLFIGLQIGLVCVYFSEGPWKIAGTLIRDSYLKLTPFISWRLGIWWLRVKQCKIYIGNT